jgi:GT2 family glycosyltransferase
MIMPSAPRRTYAYAIDSSGGPLLAPEGFLQLSGWIAGEYVAGAQVRLRLGPTSLFDCRAGEARPDVAHAHPELPGAAESGFRLETYVPPGFHVGTFEYRLVGQSDWICFHTQSIISGLGPLFAQLECVPPAEHTKEWYVHGWCFHPQCAIESVTIQFAHMQAVLEHGNQRPDVAGLHPQFSSAAHSGFTGHFPLEPGQAPVNLKVKLSNGSVLQKVMLPALTVPDRDLERAQQLASKIRAGRIKLATPTQPDVSIIIPIYNQLDFTLGCLESLVRHAGQTSFEVIIIDDCSDGNVAETLSSISGLRLHSNEKNQGFVLNCNRGAAMARGKYVLFLNNDTEVQSGWLEALHDIFDRYPDAGLVGAKLVYPDGRLQEAGGILWNNGSAWNYGRNDDPDKPEYNYVRRTDYCSGACIMLPRELFDRLDGFDERFVPAYCEDSDLAFQVRAAGYQVYYQPRAVIIHYEGQSNGTDTGGGIKRYQIVNSEKFLEKWRKVLVSEHRPGGVDVFRARERSLNRKVILFIDHYLPHYDRDAGSRTIWSYLQFFLDAGFSVKFIGHNYHPHEPYLTEMQQRGIEVLWGAWYACHWERWLEQVGPLLDYVFFSRANIATYYLPSFRRNTTAKLLFYGHDLLSRTYEHEYQVTGDPKAREAVEKWNNLEDVVFGAVDVAYYPSGVEINYLKQHRPTLLARQLPPYVFNRAARDDYYATYQQRAGLLFVGGFGHPPNVDAMLWFTKEVWPTILEKYPTLHMTIVGSNPSAEIKALSGPMITVAGYVPDKRLDELYASHKLVVVPLRLGGGIKGKVVEALWHGLPIMTTPVGAEGILDADTCMGIAPLDQFGGALLTLLGNSEALKHLARAGQRVLEQHYSSAALRRVFSQDIEFT